MSSMSMIYRVWCEWDIGQDSQVFSSLDSAIAWARDALLAQDIHFAYEDLYEDGLISISSEEVV